MRLRKKNRKKSDLQHCYTYRKKKKKQKIFIFLSKRHRIQNHKKAKSKKIIALENRTQIINFWTLVQFFIYLLHYMTESKKQNVILWIILYIILFGTVFWGFYYIETHNQPESEKEEIKTPNLLSLNEISQQLKFEKTATISSSQDILVSSQANGKVAKITHNEGDTIKAGETIVSLSDTIANYKIQLDSAKNALDRAVLTRQQTELTINQQIEQAKNALDTAKEALWNAEKGAELAIQQAELGVTNADNQIETLKNSFVTQKNTFINVLNSVLDTSDNLLGVTDYYEDKMNKSIDVYLGAKDVRIKNQPKDELKALYTLRDEIKDLKDIPETNEELLNNTLQLEEGYQKTFAFSKIMEQVMENSIASQGTLSQETINTYKKSFQDIQYGTTLTARSNLITYLSNVNSQLNNSGTISQESADITLKNAALSAKNNLFQAETAVKNAETAYNTVTENKDIQLQLLSNTISDARLAYERALTQYNRLQISSPIDGVIEQIMVTEGQEIWAWTQVFRVSGTKKQEIEVSLTAEEYQYIHADLPVEVEYQNTVLSGMIKSLSTVADKNNLYRATIQLEADIPLLWDLAKINFPIILQENTILPLEQVKILNSNEGEIAIREGGEQKSYPIKIKKTRGKFVELQESLPWDITIVMK